MNRQAIDTNVLIYAHIPSLPEHSSVRAFLLDQLAAEDVTLVVTPMILHEVVHVLTDARRFEPPLPMAEALSVARLYLDRANVECLEVDAKSIRLALELLEQHQLGRKRIADTLFAATLITHGVQKVITCNKKDFEVFGRFELIDPSSDTSP